jgi:WD40 repeat protein
MQVVKLPGRDLAPEALGFSPDGKLLAAWDRGGAVLVIDTEAGVARALWTDGTEYGYCTPGVGFTANGRKAVTLHVRKNAGVFENKSFLVLDTKTGKTRRLADVDAWALDVGVNGLVVHSKHERMGPERVVLWDTRTDKRRFAFERTVGFTQQLAVSPDGQWVAESCSDLIRLWNLTDAEPPKRARRQFRTDRNRTTWALAVSAGGEYVAATSVGLYIWDVRTGKETRIAKAKPEWGREIAFHPSRPVLAYSGGTAEVAFYDAATRRELSRFAWGVGKITAVAFSQDGLRCAAAGKGKVVIWDVDA